MELPKFKGLRSWSEITGLAGRPAMALFGLLLVFKLAALLWTVREAIAAWKCLQGGEPWSPARPAITVAVLLVLDRGFSRVVGFLSARTKRERK